MARAPLMMESPVGTLIAIDMGAGVCALVIHGEDGAQSYPLDAAMALRLQAWLAGGIRRRGQPSNIDYQLVADLYQSDEAGEYEGGRRRFVMDQLGVSHHTAGGRITKAKELGLITETYREASTNGRSD